MTNKPQYIIVHHTGGTDAQPLLDTSNFTFKQCDDLHKQRFNMLSSLGYYVGYHYFIEKDGKVYQSRKDDEEGAHTIGKNTSSIGICLSGNFDATLPTEAQKRSLVDLLLKKTKEHGINAMNIVPHRAFATKTCYGKKLSDSWARELILDSSIPPINPNKPKYKFTMALGWSYTPSEAVKNLQKILQYEGCLSKGYVVDGIFKDETARALKTWQISHGILDFQLESDVKKIRAGMKTIIVLNSIYS